MPTISPIKQAKKLSFFLLVLVGCIFSTTVVQAKPSFSVRPPQPWVKSIEPASSSDQTVTSSSSSFVLDDHQIRVGKSVDRYYHHVQRIDTTAGLNDLSQLRLYFEPTFQQLTIHFIRLHRGGSTINALNPKEIEVIQEEKELDQQLYNGTLAALIFLHDLRVGDVVDYAYTVSGENPVLNGRFADHIYLADQQPIEHLSVRFLFPTDRSVSIKSANTDMKPEVHNLGSENEYVWERRSVSAIEFEDSLPGWFNPYPSVTLSEFAGWGDVVQWALPMYAINSTTSPELREKIERWQKDFASPGERAIAALRFVQDEVRYLGIELGRYSHQPTSPEKVFKRRFGDCKDKSLLLSVVLNSMGIEAAPALVNTSVRRSLDNWQPTPYAFDHVIVQARIDGRVYWFDPTASYQRGPIERYYDPRFERALVIRQGVEQLEQIPLPSIDSGSTQIREAYKASGTEAPVSLSVTTTLRGADADDMRYMLAGSSVADLSKRYLNYYAEENPSITIEALPEIADDEITNTITITERYLITEFWKDKRHRFSAAKIYDELSKPDVSQRKMPLFVRYPLSIDHLIEIDLSSPFAIPRDSGTIANDAFRFDYSYDTVGNLIKLAYSLKTHSEHVPTAKVPQHLLTLDRVHDHLGFELTNGVTSVAGLRSRSNSKVDAIFGVAALGVMGLALGGYLIKRQLQQRRDSRLRTPRTAKAGSTPETAIRLPSNDEMERFLHSYQCMCGERPYRPDAEPVRERFTYDGQRLVGVRLKCSGCGSNNDVYLSSLADPMIEQPT
ncbi:MAG TPA: DUF3857 domain-containing transglutaminase family protein [Pyrinomonadaceae bacterium]